MWLLLLSVVRARVHSPVVLVHAGMFPLYGRFVIEPMGFVLLHNTALPFTGAGVGGCTDVTLPLGRLLVG